MINRFAAILAMAFFVVGAAPVAAQVSVNGIEIIDSNYHNTGNTVLSQPGATLTIRNDFPVSVTVRIRPSDGDTSGTPLAEVGVGTSPNNVETGNHGQGVGNYTFTVEDPSVGTEHAAGKLNVSNPTV